MEVDEDRATFEELLAVCRHYEAGSLRTVACDVKTHEPRCGFMVIDGRETIDLLMPAFDGLKVKTNPPLQASQAPGDAIAVMEEFGDEIWIGRHEEGGDESLFVALVGSGTGAVCERIERIEDSWDRPGD